MCVESVALLPTLLPPPYLLARYIKAQLKRAELYMVMNDYEEAIADYEAVKAVDPYGHGVAGLLRTAKQRLATHEKEQEKREPFEILEVERNADDNTIKRAFKKKAMRMHPDRVTDPHMKRRAEKEFKQLNEAYRILSDPAERAKLTRKNRSSRNDFSGFGSSARFYSDDDDYDDVDSFDEAEAGYYGEFFRGARAGPRCQVCSSPAASDCSFRLCGGCCKYPGCKRHSSKAKAKKKK
jgi:tetratricopeptide (TPR) repeat protein